MNPDPALDVDDVIADEFDDGVTHIYGLPDAPLWYSTLAFDGGIPMTQRRPEVTGDQHDALIADITAWVEWLVPTYRLQAKISPCWPRHAALVEELSALFYLWQHCWLPANDPTLPVAFLRELDGSLSRIERHWKIPCDATEHKEPKDVSFTSTGAPRWRAWWANPAFDSSDRAVPAPRPDRGGAP